MRVKLLSLAVIFLFSSVFASAALDLAFTTVISQSPDPVAAGVEATFTVSFRTNGGAVTNLKIIGGVDGTQLFERTYASILADKTKTDYFTWTATAGNHTVWFELDPNHTCGDSNYANNRIEKAITVSGGEPTGKPDLRVSYIDVSPKIFKSGSPITLSILVSNTGDVASSPCKLAISKGAGNLAFAVLDVPAIEAHKHTYITHQWHVDCDVNLRVTVDPTDIIDESNEVNNYATKKMTCELNIRASDLTGSTYPREDPYGPDLTVRWMPDTSEYPDKYSIYMEVENLSPIPSTPCKMATIYNDSVRYTQDITSLKQNEIFTISTVWFKQDVGVVTLYVDWDHKNVERNEKNNVAKRIF
jgi:subtilase family serine protease